MGSWLCYVMLCYAMLCYVWLQVGWGILGTGINIGELESPSNCFNLSHSSLFIYLFIYSFLLLTHVFMLRNHEL